MRLLQKGACDWCNHLRSTARARCANPICNMTGPTHEVRAGHRIADARKIDHETNESQERITSASSGAEQGPTRAADSRADAEGDEAMGSQDIPLAQPDARPDGTRDGTPRDGTEGDRNGGESQQERLDRVTRDYRNLREQEEAMRRNTLKEIKEDTRSRTRRGGRG